MASKAESNAPKIDANLSKGESKECILEGVIETQHVKALEILLQAISGTKKKEVKVHEIVLKKQRNLRKSVDELRLRCSLEGPQPSWTVTHIGGNLRGATGEKIPALVRNREDSKVSNNAIGFLYKLGFKFDHELLRVGFTFKTIQKVTTEAVDMDFEITTSVTSIHKIPKVFQIDKAEPLTPGLHLVEVSTPTTGEIFHEAAAAISTYSELLAPLIHLSKPGYITGLSSTASTAAASIMPRAISGVPDDAHTMDA